MDLSKKIHDSIYASIIGDALGVPVQHATRQELALCSVKNMLGYGRYDQPEGTWSDDSSMILCTMESLSNGYDINDLADIFCKWIFDGHWTATGFVFDSGLTTFQALESIRTDKKSPKDSGLTSEDDNGNGSLMRILPVALYFSDESIEDMLEIVHEVSAITHAHPRSKMGCGIYSVLIKNLIESDDKNEAFKKTIDQAEEYYVNNPDFKNELHHFDRILSGDLPTVKKENISSTGYVVNTLEASMWCFLNGNSTHDILLDAVNLGLDTDTTGTVAGGLSGLFYGLESVSQDWINSIARKDDVEKQIKTFTKVLTNKLNSK